MKKIIITGGTGLIGSNLIRLLKSKGYYIINLTRNTDISIKKVPEADEHILWTNNSNWFQYLEDVYTVINLAGASLADGKWTSSRKEILYNSRIKSTETLVNAMKSVENPPKIFISASAVGYYKSETDFIITESSQMGSGFLSKLCNDWENEAQKAKEFCRVVIPRIGVVLSSEGGALNEFIRPYKFFIGGPLGNGKQWLPWVHIQDLCKMFLFALENEKIENQINFTSPNPVTMNQFSTVLGKVLKRPSIFRVPGFILKLILGEKSIMVLEGQRILPERLIKAQASDINSQISI